MLTMWSVVISMVMAMSVGLLSRYLSGSEGGKIGSCVSFET